MKAIEKVCYYYNIKFVQAEEPNQLRIYSCIFIVFLLHCTTELQLVPKLQPFNHLSLFVNRLLKTLPELGSNPRIFFFNFHVFYISLLLSYGGFASCSHLICCLYLSISFWKVCPTGEQTGDPLVNFYVFLSRFSA